MMKPDDIPQAVWDEADTLVGHEWGHHSYESLVRVVGRAMVTASAREREGIARQIEQIDDLLSPYRLGIAIAIRNRIQS